MLAIKANLDALDDKVIVDIDRAISYIRKYCERVDRGQLNGPSDSAKAKSVIRRHEQLVSEIEAFLHRGVF